MTVSAKAEYACIAVLELALSYGSGRPVQVRRIAESHTIPARFLVQILLQLKGAGLVTSTRGAGGGYMLAKPPGRVTLWDVMSVVEGVSAEPAQHTGQNPVREILARAWRGAADARREYLDSTTFADLAERVHAATGSMYYI